MALDEAMGLLYILREGKTASYISVVWTKVRLVQDNAARKLLIFPNFLLQRGKNAVQMFCRKTIDMKENTSSFFYLHFLNVSKQILYLSIFLLLG